VAGIGVYNCLFHSTAITHSFNLFIDIIGVIISLISPDSFLLAVTPVEIYMKPEYNIISLGLLSITPSRVRKPYLLRNNFSIVLKHGLHTAKLLNMGMGSGPRGASEPAPSLRYYKKQFQYSIGPELRNWFCGW
jgi:hypothetical protein